MLISFHKHTFSFFSDPGNKAAVGTLGFVSAIMFTFPLFMLAVTWIVCRHIAEGASISFFQEPASPTQPLRAFPQSSLSTFLFSANVDDSIMAAGVVAVLSVNLVSFGYVYYAYMIEDLDGPSTEDAQQEETKKAK